MPIAERFLHALSHLPLKIRRSTLRVAFALARWMGLARSEPGVMERVSAALHMPRRRAARIASAAVFHDMMFSLEWLALKNRRARGLLADAQAVSITGEDTLLWASRQRTVILATLHMASYATSLARLLHGYFQDRLIVIVRSKATTSDERDALAKLSLIGIRAELLFLDSPETFLELIRSVKRGAILITLVDLPRNYGRSCDVELLWHPARIAIGVADLSALCRAPIVLFKTVSGMLGDEVIVESVIDTGSMTDKKRQQAADSIAAFINSAVVARPEQWHMWGRLTEYAIPAGPAL